MDHKERIRKVRIKKKLVAIKQNKRYINDKVKQYARARQEHQSSTEKHRFGKINQNNQLCFYPKVP